MNLTDLLLIAYILSSSAKELQRECPIQEIQYVSEDKCTRGHRLIKGHKKYIYRESKVLAL